MAAGWCSRPGGAVGAGMRRMPSPGRGRSFGWRRRAGPCGRGEGEAGSRSAAGTAYGGSRHTGRRHRPRLPQYPGPVLAMPRWPGPRRRQLSRRASSGRWPRHPPGRVRRGLARLIAQPQDPLDLRPVRSPTGFLRLKALGLRRVSLLTMSALDSDLKAAPRRVRADAARLQQAPDQPRHSTRPMRWKDAGH